MQAGKFTSYGPLRFYSPLGVYMDHFKEAEI